ncbi:glycosyltransferase family 4 protein [Paenibacillus aurantiacus]|uniref:Glycosyltransferase family 4 protein n=1 Tax=Paenibacillus aurantiacus TaxID=1936118 RepID=A0ABV5KYG0_9BACL
MPLKPKLLVFSHICSPQYVTGAEKVLMFMLRELQPYFTCTLVVPTEGVIAQQARAYNIPVICHDVPLVVPLYLALPHLMGEIESLQRTEAWPALIELIRREQPDVALVNTTVHPLPAIAAKMLGVPVIWSVMEAIRFTPHTANSAALIEHCADLVVGISEATLAPLRTPGLLPKSIIIPPSWNPDALHPESWPELRAIRRADLGVADHQKLVGYISASIFDAKGLDHFMQMAVEVSERFPDALFLIVGNPTDPAYFEQCLERARSRDLMGKFRWIRFEENVETIYPAMDITVIPSIEAEGFGMTALEAMVFGRPVVLYGAGGLAEIAGATGNSAYMARPGDTGGLFARVWSLLGDPARMAAAGAHNASAVQAAFGIDVYRRRIVHLVGLLAGRGVLPPSPVKGTGDTVYRFENGLLRPYRTGEALQADGFSYEQVREVSDLLIAMLPKGEPIGSLPPPKRGRRSRTAGRRRVLARARRKRGRRRPIRGIAAGRRRARRIGARHRRPRHPRRGRKTKR